MWHGYFAGHHAAGSSRRPPGGDGGKCVEQLVRIQVSPGRLPVQATITQADIVNLIWSLGPIIDATSATAPTAWRWYLYLMLDAYRAERAHPLPEPPMADQQLYDAMVHLSKAE
jgi:hypothetical protein